MHREAKIRIVPLIISFVTALVLSILPIPHWLQWLWPNWLLLTLIGWSLYLPSRINVGAAFCVGIILDALTGSYLGENALVFTLIIYLVVKFQHLLRTCPLWQQSIAMLLFVSLNQLLATWIHAWMSDMAVTDWYWLTPVTSMLFWPWIIRLLRRYQNPLTFM